MNEEFLETELSNQEAQWISLSDLMTGLMMVFLLLAVIFMIKVEEVSKAKQTDTLSDNAKNELYKELQKLESEKIKVKQIAVLYNKIRSEFYDELYNEFKQDLNIWRAEITKDLTVKFKEPDVLFNTGKDDLKIEFQNILQNFFPRYIKIIMSDKYRNTIQEIRIEGHTSSLWAGAINSEEAYFKNMELSQARTRSTLRFLLNLPEAQQNIKWLHKYVTANGLSSSRPIINIDGIEDTRSSQRVEFRIRTDAESRLANIIEAK